MLQGKIMSRLISIITNIVIVFAVFVSIINIFLIFDGNHKKTILPDVFGYKFLIELSDSMQPVLEKGDLVIIKETSEGSLHVGDIVSYRDSNNNIITHRISTIVQEDGKSYYETKGDNNKSTDNTLVSFKQIEGAYVTYVSGLGNILIFLSSKIGMAVSVLVVVVMFLVGFLIQKLRFSK